MSKIMPVVLAGVLFLGGCALEQFHRPAEQAAVTVKVIVALSEAYPNDVIKEITEQRMYDGTTRYKFIITAKGQDHIVAFTPEGKPVENPI